MELEFHKKQHGKFEGYFFKKLKFLYLELHGRFEFHKLEFQKGGRLLNISQTVVDPYIFSQIVVYAILATFFYYNTLKILKTSQGGCLEEKCREFFLMQDIIYTISFLYFYVIFVIIGLVYLFSCFQVLLMSS